MEQVTINMATMNTHNENNYDRRGAEKTEIPPTIDSERPPQRNDDNATGTCACPCACSGDGGESGKAIKVEPGEEGAASSASSEAGDEVEDGDEGTEDHLIEVGDFGFIPLSLIHRTLAKHARCTCHLGVLPDPGDYASTARTSPRTSPGDSMIVEFTSSGEPSMASSGLFSHHSRGSSVFEYMHGGIDPGDLLQALPLLYRPLQLTEEVEFAYPVELSISSISSISDRDWSVPADDFAEYDLW